MSIEPLVISGLVEEGSPKKAFVLGVNKHDFQIYSEEFEWLEERFDKRKPINRRLFCERFPDFEFVRPKESTEELLEELKTEMAFSAVAALIDSASESLLPENAIETAEHMRGVLNDVVKLYSINSDISLKESGGQYEQIKQRRMLTRDGQTVGMPFLIPSLDFFFDGLCGGRLYAVLGRPGHGKSFLETWIGWSAIKTGGNIGLFSPEMNEDEHRCRLHTLASADLEVQRICDLKGSFRNRDLMRGTGFDIKAYKRFCEYFETLPGDCRLFTKKYRKDRLTAQYIGSRIEDLGLQGVMVDPIRKIFTNHYRRNNDAVWEHYDKVYAFQELIEEHNVFGVATNWSTRQQGRAHVEKPPDMDDSFGADALAQESDHVIGLLHDEQEKTLIMKCSKSRFGKGKFTVFIDFDPNLGVWREVNISGEVVQFRASLGDKQPQNGTGERKRLISKVKKLKVGV